eukprot:scaffold61244_cov31-Tisochrysis_lutea.AAC.2
MEERTAMKALTRHVAGIEAAGCEEQLSDRFGWPQRVRSPRSSCFVDLLVRVHPPSGISMLRRDESSH